MARTDPRPHYGTKRRVRADGYIDLYLPDHPLARRDGYVMEHRFVAHSAGWLIPDGWQIHHKNHVRDDNRIENLEVVRIDDHARLHARERGTITNQFGTHALRAEKACERCGTSFMPWTRLSRFCSLSCANRRRNTARACGLL